MMGVGLATVLKPGSHPKNVFLHFTRRILGHMEKLKMETVETETGNRNWKRKLETYMRTVTSTWQEGHCLRKGCVLALRSALAT